MKGAWKVTSNIVDYRTRKMRYSCVRVIDMSQPEHSGNREELRVWYTSEAAAALVAEALNQAEVLETA